MNDEQKSTAGVVGVGVAACAACCAGPVLAAVGGLTTAGPIAGGVALVAGGVAYARHRRQPAPDSPDTESES